MADDENSNPKPVSYSTRRSLIKMPSFDQTMLSGFGRRTKLFMLVAVCGLVGFLGGWAGQGVHNSSLPSTKTTAGQVQVVSSEGSLISKIAKDVGASVVSVNVAGQSTATDIFGVTQQQETSAAGTGFVISASGIIVTNRHVVPLGTTKVSVTLSDGTKYDNVEVIGRSSPASTIDVAFLKIGDLKAKTLTPVSLGDSSKTQVGDRVVAIGNALGQFQNTVTSGIISGFGRDLTAGDQAGGDTENLSDLIQTDTAINEGNSGGPLVDINGHVIGINTAVAGNANNIGFAIPINNLKGLINTVLATGKFEQPFLGVHYVILTPEAALQYNLSLNKGAYIAPATTGESVVPDSPAAKAGLKEKDIITKVNGTSIDDKNGLTALLSQYKVGDKITLTIVRDGKTQTVPVTLQAAPSS